MTERVRAGIPAELPLLLRISATDWIAGDRDIEQSVEAGRARTAARTVLGTEGQHAFEEEPDLIDAAKERPSRRGLGIAGRKICPHSDAVEDCTVMLLDRCQLDHLPCRNRA